MGRSSRCSFAGVFLRAQGEHFVCDVHMTLVNGTLRQTTYTVPPADEANFTKSVAIVCVCKHVRTVALNFSSSSGVAAAGVRQAASPLTRRLVRVVHTEGDVFPTWIQDSAVYVEEPVLLENRVLIIVNVNTRAHAVLNSVRSKAICSFRILPKQKYNFHLSIDTVWRRVPMPTRPPPMPPVQDPRPECMVPRETEPRDQPPE